MNFQSILLFLPAMLISMTFHEAAHALMGYWLGDDTAKREGRVSLNPLVHIDPIFTVAVPAVMLALGLSPILAAKPVPFNPHIVRFKEFGGALIALAGPITNILLAFVSAFVFARIGSQPGIFNDFMSLFILLNISLAVFNLVPWPPLDGSRVLYALAPEPVQGVMRQIESFGISGLFIFIFVAYPVISPVIETVKEALLSAIVRVV
jgi:Zn-dependent protease